MGILTARRPKSGSRERWAGWFAVPLAVLGHALMLGCFLGYSALINRPRPAPVQHRPVSLRRIDSKQWATNRGRLVQAPLERMPAGQVVDVTEGNKQRPVDSKYLAMANNRVTKESRARKRTPAATPPPGRPPPPSGIDLAESVFGRKQPAAILTPSFASTSAQSEAPAPSGTEGGGGASNDDLDAVAEGDNTYLNTREWKYASFFNRVKQAVSARWDPNARLKAKARGLDANERLTVLRVALRPDGSIADLFVAQSCGLDALDVEAMNAFTKAQPFANPPAALVENGLIIFGFSFRVTNDGLPVSGPLRRFTFESETGPSRFLK